MSRIETLFFRGNHADVLRATVDSPRGRHAARDTGWVIGALAFQGRIEEAEALFVKSAGALGPESLAAARFFLGVGFCRHSFYAKARGYFAELLRARRRDPGGRPRIAFYAAQGHGFYHFFSGRFARALAAARVAHGHAARAGFLWGKLVSTDLMGHCLVQTGEISQGMRALKLALGHAESLGDGGLRQALEVSRRCYGAQFGLGRDSGVLALERLPARIAAHDTYSRSAVRLELARQYALRGRLADARRMLNDCCQRIYGSRNRRQGVILNLRYATVYLLAGEREQALNFIRNAARELDPQVDRALEVEVTGLELAVLKSLGAPAGTLRTQAERLARLTAITGKGTGRRMLARSGDARTAGNHLSWRHAGEDPAGDLLDRVARVTRGGADAAERDVLVEELFRRGYHGLLSRLVEASPDRPLLSFDLRPGALVIFDRGEVDVRRAGVTPIIVSLARALFEARSLTKAELIERVWGYRYRPGEHDPLIYTAISKFRQLLGERSAWLEATESGYRLDPRPEARFAPVAQPVVSGAPSPKMALDSSLNHRQILLLRQLEQQEFIQVGECRRRFKVSEITACRDLAELTRRGLLRRIGKARATRYTSTAFHSGGGALEAAERKPSANDREIRA